MKETSEITRDVLRRRDEWQRSRRERRRGVTRCMAVLVLGLALCIGAVAAGSNTLADFFAGYRGGDLSPEQEAVASLAEGFETRTAVSGDWTVSIDKAVCDGLNYYLTMSVTGPAGWRDGTTNIEWGAVELISGGQIRRWGTKYFWHKYELAEADTDYYVMCITLEEPTEGPLTMELRDMVLLRGEPEDWQKEEGTWLFKDLEFAVAGEPVELLAAPVTIKAENAIYEGSCKVQLDSVQLRTFALHISYSHMNQTGGPELEGLLVLKDGSTYELRFSISGSSAGGTLEAVFGFPVLPEEVDHILLEGIRLDIPR